MSRIVVIGAGVGGLAVAARLAARGHQVTVCERAAAVGGKLGVLEHTTAAGTFRFDTGPSILTMPDVFADLFRETGDPLESVLRLRPLTEIARYRYADGASFGSCADPAEFRERLDNALGGGAGAQWAGFWRRAERIWNATSGPFLSSSVDGVATLARLGLRIGDLATIAPWQTLRGLAANYLTDPRLRTFVERYATYTGSDPRRAPAALAAVPYAELKFGGWYLDGGLHTLAAALLNRCIDRGVTVRTGAEVTRILTTNGRASGVLVADSGSPTTDGKIDADVVIANVDAHHLYRDLIPMPGQLRRLGRATPSLSGFVLLLGLRGRTPGLAHHTVLFPAGAYEAEFDAVFGESASPAADPTLYVSAPDDSTVRPDGHEAWFVLVNAPRHGVGSGAVDWRAPGLANRYAEHLLGRLAARGVEVRDRVEFMAVRTPADLEAETAAVGGAIYGTSSNGPRAAFLRPANRSPMPGLFLVGGSSHPGGGLPLVALSAQIVAGLIGTA
jgi:phytoene desaturase